MTYELKVRNWNWWRVCLLLFFNYYFRGAKGGFRICHILNFSYLFSVVKLMIIGLACLS